MSVSLCMTLFYTVDAALSVNINTVTKISLPSLSPPPSLFLSVNSLACLVYVYKQQASYDENKTNLRSSENMPPSLHGAPHYLRAS